MLGIFILLLIAMLLVVKFCKKTLKIVLAIVIVLVALYCVIISIDMNRVESFREPIFAVEKSHDDFTMQTTSYIGVGYEVKIVKDLSTVKKIFNRYYTVENASKNSGIGLSIAKQLVELNNGTIKAIYNDNYLNIEIEFI